MSNYDFDDKDYNEGRKAAMEDKAVGKHTMELTEDISEKIGQKDGEPYLSAKGMLTSFNNLKVTLYLRPYHSAQSIKDTMEDWKRKSMGNNNDSLAALKKMGKTVTELKAGDTMQVLTGRDRPQPGYDTGFVKVLKVLGPAKDDGHGVGEREVPF